MMNNVHILTNYEYNELLHTIRALKEEADENLQDAAHWQHRFDRLYELFNKEAYERLDAAHHEELLQWCERISKDYEIVDGRETVDDTDYKIWAEENIIKRQEDNEEELCELSCPDEKYAVRTKNLTHDLPAANYSIVRYPASDRYLKQCNIAGSFDNILVCYQILLECEVYMDVASNDYQRNYAAWKAHKIFKVMQTWVCDYNQTSSIEIAMPVSRYEFKSLTYYDNMQALKENRERYDRELYTWCSEMAKKYNRRFR